MKSIFPLCTNPLPTTKASQNTPFTWPLSASTFITVAYCVIIPAYKSARMHNLIFMKFSPAAAAAAAQAHA